MAFDLSAMMGLGGGDPALEQQLRNQALMRFGLGMMQGSGSGQPTGAIMGQAGLGALGEMQQIGQMAYMNKMRQQQQERDNTRWDQQVSWKNQERADREAERQAAAQRWQQGFDSQQQQFEQTLAQQQQTQKALEQYRAEELAQRDRLNGVKQPPTGYRYQPDGSLQFIPGGPADPNAQPKHNLPTEGQAKANAFAGEMDAALGDIDKALAEMNPEGQPATRPGLGSIAAGNLPWVGNAARGLVSSPAEQNYYNGMKRLITAKLRADSGATITQSEIDQQMDQYMPKVLDSAETIAQKKAALGTLIDSVRSRGSAMQPMGGLGNPGMAAPGAAAATSGAPVGGSRFKIQVLP